MGKLAVAVQKPRPQRPVCRHGKEEDPIVRAGGQGIAAAQPGRQGGSGGRRQILPRRHGLGQGKAQRLRRCLPFLGQQVLHQGPCTALSVNPAATQLVASAGEDGLVRLWRAGTDAMEPVAERNVHLGSVFACSFYPSVPYLLAACGTSQDLCLWDVREIEALNAVFEAPANEVVREKPEFEASERATGTLNDIKKKKRN